MLWNPSSNPRTSECLAMKPASITDAASAVAEDGSPKTAGAAATLPPPDKSPPVAKAKDHNIRVSPAVLDAAGKDGDELLSSLRATSEGLTQVEAEDRARKTGPNVVAQERRRGWFLRLLIILRNPLVILL